MRLVIFVAAVAIGVGMWLALNRTRIGVMIRAGVDDRDMLSVLGYRVQLLFVLVFAFGAGLAGMAGGLGAVGGVTMSDANPIRNDPRRRGHESGHCLFH